MRFWLVACTFATLTAAFPGSQALPGNPLTGGSASAAERPIHHFDSPIQQGTTLSCNEAEPRDIAVPGGAWDRGKGKPPVTALALTPDEKFVVVGSQAGLELRTWPT